MGSRFQPLAVFPYFDTIKSMSDSKQFVTAEPKPGEKAKPVIHRVCIQCNNMFTVTADKFEAKQCPACHKG